MEDQHPIPQQVTSYEFKLVGDMTLKQFLKAAVGIVVAIFIYKTGLLVIFKWPLMLISAGLGLALAFVPFEDRPLDTWLNAFLKSIYSPTIYLYKKKNEDWLDLTKTNNDEEATNQLYEKKSAETVFKGGVVRISNQDNNLATKPTTKLNDEEKLEATTTKNEVNNDGNEAQKIITEEKPETDDERTINPENRPIDLNLKKEKLEATGKAVFGSIPMPDRPDIPNVIVGMATNNEGKIVDGVIVEIQDMHGNPTRVIKTNALGQFKISTPLASGRYLLIAEKEGYIFDRVNIDLDGQIVDPVRIIAHN